MYEEGHLLRKNHYIDYLLDVQNSCNGISD